MSPISNEKKEEVIEAAKDAAIETYKTTANKTLKWWERALWIILAAIAAGASALLNGCGHSISVDSDTARICKDGTCIVIGVEQLQPIPATVDVKKIKGE